MAVLNNPAGHLVSGAVASGAGALVMDTRNAANYGYLVYYTPAASARMAVQASHDQTGWLDVSIVTATTTSATAQLDGFYPYVRGTVMNRYGAATANMYYAPGLV